MSTIRIDQIQVGKRLRSLRKEVVVELAKSIERLGLHSPITVVRRAPNDDGGGGNLAVYDLVAGLHRLEACKALGREEIGAVIKDMTDKDQRFWEIDENLCRAELNELERGEHLVERKRLYEAEHPETKQHVAGGHTRQGAASANLSFAGDTASHTGIDERSVQRSIHRAANIAPKVRDSIRALPVANSGVELDALASLQPEQQKQVVDLINAGEVTSIREAKAKLEAKGKGTLHSASPKHKTPPGSSKSQQRDNAVVAFLKAFRAKPFSTLEDLLTMLKDETKCIATIPTEKRLMLREGLGLSGISCGGWA